MFWHIYLEIYEIYTLTYLYVSRKIHKVKEKKKNLKQKNQVQKTFLNVKC